MRRRIGSVILLLGLLILPLTSWSETKNVIIEVNQDIINELSTVPYKDVIFLTNAKNPITDLVNIGYDEEIGIGLRKNESLGGFSVADRHGRVFFSGQEWEAIIRETANRGEIDGKLLKILRLAKANIFKKDSWELVSPVSHIVFPDISLYKPFIEVPSLRILITYKEFEDKIISNGGGAKIQFRKTKE